MLLPYCRPLPVAIAGRGLELEELNATVLVRVGHLERVQPRLGHGRRELEHPVQVEHHRHGHFLQGVLPQEAGLQGEGGRQWSTQSLKHPVQVEHHRHGHLLQGVLPQEAGLRGEGMRQWCHPCCGQARVAMHWRGWWHARALTCNDPTPPAMGPDAWARSGMRLLQNGACGLCGAQNIWPQTAGGVGTACGLKALQQAISFCLWLTPQALHSHWKSTLPNML